MWSSVFDPVKFDWFYLERLKRSWRLELREERLRTDIGSNADFHMSRTKRNDNQSSVMLMHESASTSVFFQHGFLSRWLWGWRSWRFLFSMSCFDTTMYRCLRCKFPLCNKWHFQKKTTKFQVGKLESLLRISVPCSKEAFEQGTKRSTHAVRGEDAFGGSFWS